MQGESFVQKSSSSSLWNVASFSTIMTNLADDTISEHGQGKLFQNFGNKKKTKTKVACFSKILPRILLIPPMFDETETA